MKKIIIVDENKVNIKNMQEALQSTNYDINWYQDTLEGIEALAVEHHDLLILHTEFYTELQGRLIKLARNIYPDIRVLVICTPFFKEVHLSELEGLVDQFIEPSLDAQTFLKFIQVLLLNVDNKIQDEQTLISYKEGIVLNLKTREVFKDDVLFSLTPIEFGLLEMFLSQKNTLLTREHILETIWPFSDNESTIRKVDVHIKNLRTKMNIYSISSVRGKGYQWAE